MRKKKSKKTSELKRRIETTTPRSSCTTPVISSSIQIFGHHFHPRQSRETHQPLLSPETHKPLHPTTRKNATPPPTITHTSSHISRSMFPLITSLHIRHRRSTPICKKVLGG
ncbi:unnamed protein product [Lathyrus oleraceus]